MKIKKGDTIKVLKGKDKGKIGKIEKLYPKLRSVLIEGINQYKRHIKARTKGQKSEIVTITKPVSISNVALVCPKCSKTTRIGWSVQKGEKVRICRKCHKAID